MVSSGTRLEVIERDADSGYTHVRTQGGTEGWVLTRYLMNEASAREQLENLTGQLTNATSRGSSLNSQLGAIKGQYDAANQQISTLEREKAAVEKSWPRSSARRQMCWPLMTRTRSLMDELAAAQIRADTLEQENRVLPARRLATGSWLVRLVLLVGIILGIWLPRIRWQRVHGTTVSSRSVSGDRFTGEEHPRFDDRIGVERHALDALVQQPAREVRMIGRTLAADTDVLAVRLAGRDRHRQQRLHRIVSLVEVSATSAESRSRPSASCVISFEPIDMPSKCSRY